MKKSLAPPRRDKPTGAANNSLAKKIPLKLTDQRGTSNEKSATLSIQIQSQDKAISQKFEERFRNKNLNVLPTQMLVTLSGLTTIDISYNKLTESQIELIMSSCTKLTTFCMQGNMSALIPAAIAKLKLLVNFRHDWVKLNQQEMYETEQRLEKIKDCARKPECVIKVNKIVGLDFTRYCQYVLMVSFDRALMEKIDKCDCSSFARSNMLKCMEEMSKGKLRERDRLVTIQEGEERSLIPGCFGAFGFGDPAPKKRDQKWKQAQCSTDNDSVTTANIKIEDIRDINDKQMTLTTANEARMEEIEFYSCPGFPLHQLFANFDRNPHAPADIDGLLLKGYNPNQLDNNGLTAFHLLISNRQKKGLQYLIEISANNPGFFDLELPSGKEGRGLLHFAVFMKNYLFTKMLIEFGLPIDKRDGSGARIIHLVDQNYEFLILLRKLFRKRTRAARNLATLSVPAIPHQNKKNYTKHPQRQKQQSRLRITYSRNDKLLDMYESATGVPMLPLHKN